MLFDGIGKVFAARLLKEVDSLQDMVVVYLFAESLPTSATPNIT